MEKGRIQLTAEERELSVDNLHKLLMSRGYKLKRTTAWRAKKSGWFMSGNQGRRANIGFVKLTEDEKNAHPYELVEQFGITHNTAQRAIDRGWFEVTTTNEKKLRGCEERIDKGDLPLPKNR